MRDRQQGWSAVFWCAGLALLAPQAGWTQSYPARAVRLIVPFAAGGNTDIIARFYTPKMSELLGQQIIIDNRGGAGGRTRAVNRVPACGM